jgi:hypothetical protein
VEVECHLKIVFNAFYNNYNYYQTKDFIFFSLKFIMTKFSRTSTGKYSVSGKTFDVLIGTRAQVWHGTAYKTTGGLCKHDLMQNKSGRIVSKAKHNSAKREKRLVKAGYLTKKGQFGFIKNGKSMRKGRKGSRKGSRKMRGGMSALSPSDYNGQGVGTSGNAVQFSAGNAN